jgi:hypothetical protein
LGITRTKTYQHSKLEESTKDDKQIVSLLLSRILGGSTTERPFSRESAYATTPIGEGTRMTSWYSLFKNFTADRWETIYPHHTDDLSPRIKGRARWVEYSEPNESCYCVDDSEDKTEYTIELINDQWHILTWSGPGWRTSAQRYFGPLDHKHLGLGWYDVLDLEHLDYRPLTEPQVTQIVVDPDDKGKGRASSTDLTSLREKQEASSESETEYAEPAP